MLQNTVEVISRRCSSDISGDEDLLSVYKTAANEALYLPLIEKINRRIESNDFWFSCEFFPPRSPNEAVNLVSKFDRFAKGMPLFCDVTWHPAGNPTSDSPTSSMLIANTMLNYSGIETMLHMICVDMTREEINQILNKAKIYGIKNLLALRGDLPSGAGDWIPTADGFNYAVDLVKHIRSTFGKNFVICVAGYPNGHPEAESYAKDLQYLKEKVDAGADFIITQMFFDVKDFLKFERNCREIGIVCPIIPGIMPIQGYKSLRHIVRLAKLEIPTDVLKVVESLRDNEVAIQQYGIDLAVKMCKELLSSGRVWGLHFYTLNREVATKSICQQIGLWEEQSLPRDLPWKKTANHIRMTEGIRPIFWSNRPNSYVYRTKHWDEFPQSRWGDTSVAAFKELEDPYLFYLRVRASKDDLLSMWGHSINSERNVWDTFVHHIAGTKNQHGVLVKSLPWNPNTELSLETRMIQAELSQLNDRGALTINSQPRANGVASTHSVLGWGPVGGFIYQKAYLEFFVHRRYCQALQIVLREEFTPRVNYHIVQATNGDITNCDEVRPIAVTWGVFPGSEIVQPTVVDPLAFKYWKMEAFDLWLKHWAVLYEEESQSREVLRYIYDNYLLVNLVDNDFTEESCLFELVNKALDFETDTTCVAN